MDSIVNNWLNINYLNSDTIRNVKSAFLSKNTFQNIELQSFLKTNVFENLKKEMLKLNYKLNYCPNIHSYFFSEVPESFLSLIESQDFKHLIAEITNLKIKEVTAEACLFKHKNYTLLNDKTIKEGLAFFLDFNNWNIKYGGYNWLLNKNKENIIYHPKPNSFLLVKQSKNLMSTIKYINHLAKDKKRYLIKGLFTLK